MNFALRIGMALCMAAALFLQLQTHAPELVPQGPIVRVVAALCLFVGPAMILFGLRTCFPVRGLLAHLVPALLFAGGGAAAVRDLGATALGQPAAGLYGIVLSVAGAVAGLIAGCWALNNLRHPSAEEFRQPLLERGPIAWLLAWRRSRAMTARLRRRATE